MTSSKTPKTNSAPEEMTALVTEINELAKIRAALSLGTQTGERNSAESLMSRRITKRVNTLSKLILNQFKDD